MKKRFVALTLTAIMMGTVIAPATVSAALEDYEIVTSA